MSLPEILIFSDDQRRILKPDEFKSNNFVLQLLGLRQYSSEINLLETPVYRDLQNNIVYFRDILPITSKKWDIYMNAVRFGDVNQEDIDELKAVINIFGGDEQVEKIIKNMLEDEKIESKYLNPRNPSEDIYNLYIFKKASVNLMNQYTIVYSNYTITDIVSEQPEDVNPMDQLHWVRKPIS